MQVVAQHDAPIRHLFYVKEMGGGMLITGSWDKTIRYWDLRQAPAASCRPDPACGHSQIAACGYIYGSVASLSSD